ncbi:MAG TPA: GNAT family N-acetyltransferase [Stellaceae bacterium]|nr:GNAT family N-acetyltransferase [Stellaceae bacterium]
MPDLLPTFRTSRLTVRPRGLGDLEACLAMDRDPQVTRFIPGPWADPAAHRAFVEQRMRHAYPAGMGYWAILTSEGFVGWILLTPLDLHGPEIEIGWRLVRAAWGRGYATEAARPVLGHALYTLRLPEVIADIDPANTASVGIARKLGFRPQGPVSLEDGRIVTRHVAGPATAC